MPLLLLSGLAGLLLPTERHEALGASATRRSALQAAASAALLPLPPRFMEGFLLLATAPVRSERASERSFRTSERCRPLKPSADGT